MKVVYIRESIFSSLVKDAFTFGCLFAMWYLNFRFCGGSGVINVTVALMVILSVHSLFKKKYSPKEALEILQEMARQSSESAPVANNGQSCAETTKGRA